MHDTSLQLVMYIGMRTALQLEPIVAAATGAVAPVACCGAAPTLCCAAAALLLSLQQLDKRKRLYKHGGTCTPSPPEGHHRRWPSFATLQNHG